MVVAGTRRRSGKEGRGERKAEKEKNGGKNTQTLTGRPLCLLSVRSGIRARGRPGLPGRGSPSSPSVRSSPLSSPKSEEPKRRETIAREEWGADRDGGVARIRRRLRRACGADTAVLFLHSTPAGRRRRNRGTPNGGLRPHKNIRPAPERTPLELSPASPLCLSPRREKQALRNDPNHTLCVSGSAYWHRADPRSPAQRPHLEVSSQTVKRLGAPQMYKNVRNKLRNNTNAHRRQMYKEIPVCAHDGMPCGHK